MARPPKEWLEQADYDMGTAEDMFSAGRYFYAVFMCHLAIEKALKGAYAAKLAKDPPKTHSLVGLLKDMGLSPPPDVGHFIVRLSQASVVTRYPEKLASLKKAYGRTRTASVLAHGREALTWIRGQF
ncbi:MAG TPA: HEPN domain-containing protein [Planctomycetota bacterium]|nr:HEPN domain-containing protein [Planctomycetota bacterium]HRR80761.1 HEPN domain-containing protein [Planctomycetota bacterium]HRT95073.1 HEPN domain-containing protein [Planctomycetota bacterium]